MMRRLIFSIKPVAILRLGLGVMFIYSGVSLITQPSFWYWAIQSLPNFLVKMTNAFGLDLFLRLQGGIELIIGIIFLLWFLPKKIVRIASLLAFMEIAGITTLVGINEVTFRDLGLLGGLWATYLLSRKETC